MVHMAAKPTFLRIWALRREQCSPCFSLSTTTNHPSAPATQRDVRCSNLITAIIANLRRKFVSSTWRQALQVVASTAAFGVGRSAHIPRLNSYHRKHAFRGMHMEPRFYSQRLDARVTDALTRALLHSAICRGSKQRDQNGQTPRGCLFHSKPAARFAGSRPAVLTGNSPVILQRQPGPMVLLESIAAYRLF